MLSTAAHQHISRSPRSQQEHRLLNQLQHIDQRLRQRGTVDDTLKTGPIWEEAGEDESGMSGEWGNCRGGVSSLACAGYEEYFSQIGNRDADEDSLFDGHNYFLKQSNVPNEFQTLPPQDLRPPLPQKQEMKFGHRTLSKGKTSSPNLLSGPQARIMKERNYVYKKESVELAPTVARRSLGTVSRSKGNGVPMAKGKSKQKVGEVNLRAKREQQNKKSSKQKYICTNNAEVEQQASNIQSESYKLSMFESFLSKSKVGECALSKSGILTKGGRKDESDNVSLECTFKPTILKKSAHMAKSNKNVVQRLSTAVYHKQEKRPYQVQSRVGPDRNRIQKLSQPRRLKTLGPEMSEEIPCFRPSLSKKSLEQMSNCIYDVATRNQLWLEQREEKIKWMREEEQRERIKKQNCTYSPSLCVYRGDNNPQFSRFGKEGITGYFQRVTNKGKGKLEEGGLMVREKMNIKEGQARQNKQNKGSLLNQERNFVRVGKKDYDQAVKHLHNRIMGLRI